MNERTEEIGSYNPRESLAAVNASARLSVGGALDELPAIIEQLYIVERCLVVWLQP